MLIDKRLMGLARQHSTLTAAATATLCLGTATHWAQAWFLAQALAALVPHAGTEAGGAPPLAAVAGGLVAVLGCALLRGAIQQLHARCARALGGDVRLEVRGALASAMLDPARLHTTTERGGARRLALSDGVDGIDSYLTAYIPHALQVRILCPVLLVAVAALNPLLAVALVLSAAIALGAPRIWDRMMERRSSTHWDSYESLGADFLEALQGMRTLKILDAVPRFRTRLEHRSTALHSASVATMRLSLADTALADFGIQAGLLAAAVLAALSGLGLVPQGIGSGPAMVFLSLMLASELFRPVRDLARQWHAGYLGLSALGGIDAAVPGFMEAPSAAHQAPGRSGAQGPSRHGGRVTRDSVLALHDLRFRYAPELPWVLDGASAQLRPGGVTALAGPSGAGKTTLFDVILGFLPAQGQCLLDGAALTTDCVGVVSQHSYLFPGTIRSNLAAVKPSASDAQMRQALLLAGLARDLADWPLGLDHAVQEAGGSLSGGQRQRLAIARAILADRPVLLLDEPTSALDRDLAADLMATLRTLAEQRIVLMIAHRPETLAAADRVLQLQHGSLRELAGASRQVAP